jgi:ketosteroid isomerase-like protein
MTDSIIDSATAALAAQIDALTRRVDALEAERDIRAVLYRYCDAIDHGDADAWAAQFTPDGVWEVGGPAVTAPYRVVGTDALRQFATEHTHSPGAWHKHSTMESTIAVEGATATATTYTCRLDGLSDGPALQSFGRYVDRLVRNEGGRWRIAHRLVHVESMRSSPFGHRPARRDSEGR